MLTATEAAQALGVSKRHLYALAAKGLLPCYRFGSAVRQNSSHTLQVVNDWLTPHRTTTRASSTTRRHRCTA